MFFKGGTLFYVNLEYMRVIAIVVLVAFMMSCQNGMIPCPTVKTAKLKRSNVNRGFTASSKYPGAERDVTENSASGTSSQSETTSNKTTRSKYIKHVSVEEWDCPKPGSKKYMPKSVKENIKRNMKRISSESDSTRYQR
jgi:hypothetical protein